ncbi:uncharacterized protein LOC126989161, partial [Eriocheir sinensis]|uniref:uncharacterized protein LOC126989161 n=1 Tax=Eriocheir sinensis TaxID=95602 RepID=UPI0021C88F01
SLLKSFCKTPDGFRVDFRSGKIQPGETYEQFSIQLGRSFEQWLEASNIDFTYASLKDFMLLDQFISSLLPDLRTFIKERGAAGGRWQLADDWSSARHSYPRSPQSSSASKKTHKKDKASFDSGSPAAKVPAFTLKCHQCGEVGHIRPRCPKNPRAFKDAPSSSVNIGFCWEDRKVSNYCVAGTINGAWTSTIIRDAGCSSLIVSEEALPDVGTDCVASSRPGKVGTRTLVLPSDCRQIVLQVAHESPLAGFPEAIPLKDVDSVSVAEALLSSFSRVGIPREILSDRVHHTVSSEWEMPSDRTGLSALDLLYGRTVRGPLTVLKDLWEDRDLQEEERTSLQYVIELREKLTECAQLAAREADGNAQRPHRLVGPRSLYGRTVQVLERRNKVDYLVDDPRGPKLYHANLLKRYHRRAQVNFAYVKDDTSAPDDDCSPTGPLEAEDPDDLVPCPLVCSVPDSALNPALDINKSLEWNQRSSLEDVLSTFKDVFSETPGCTNTLQHDIILTTTNRVLTKNYPVPIHLRPYFEKEVNNLLQLGIIQHASSQHCSPVVMVRKSDGSYRMAIDFRQLNSVTVFDAEPTCSVEGDLHKFAGATYFSELDLCKAYYQIPLTDRAKPLTAFSTHQGLMEFCRLPFGLVTACSTYIRLMRTVLADLPNISFYFDNVFIYSSDWPSHLTALTSVLERLRHHRLTAKPSKCRFGFPSIQYLGFVIDVVHLRPMRDKTEALKQISPPTTKKSLRSFLGMASFYRCFIPMAAELTGPLSDLPRKPQREPLPWTEDLLSRFEQLKDALPSQPVLRLPNPALPFVLRTDASNFGLGAVLLQYYKDTPHPVWYASRKLLDRERRYAPIEREALAILFGISKFDFYLRGKEFILETDHKPLVYLHKSKCSNDRLLRWALQLQNYPFRLVHLAGRDNVGADFLSRSLGGER